MKSIIFLALAASTAIASRNQLTFTNPLIHPDLAAGRAVLNAASDSLLGAEKWAEEGVRQFKQEFHLDGGMHCEFELSWVAARIRLGVERPVGGGSANDGAVRDPG